MPYSPKVPSIIASLAIIICNRHVKGPPQEHHSGQELPRMVISSYLERSTEQAPLRTRPGISSIVYRGSLKYDRVIVARLADHSLHQSWQQQSWHVYSRYKPSPFVIFFQL